VPFGHLKHRGIITNTESNCRTLSQTGEVVLNEFKFTARH
jgi:hypothetical protein